MAQKVAIVGVGQTAHAARRPDVNVGELITEAVRAALEDAELTLNDIDGTLVSDMDLFEGDYLSDLIFSDYAGSYLKPSFKMNTGGTTGGTAALAGWNVVASGLHDVIINVTYQKIDTPIDSQACMITACEPTYDRDMFTGALGVLAQLAEKYVIETGCTEEAVARCRVRADKNAFRNPNSHLKRGMTVESVMDSRMLAYPLRLDHICPNSCGACALIMASEKKASSITKKPVWFKDHVTVHQEGWAPLSAVGPSPAPNTHQEAARILYKRNGITDPRKETQVFEMYTPSAYQELAWIESFGLCEQGQAWRMEEKGIWDIEGEYAVNPSGGVVATNPIGATGMIRVAEAALQIRGDAGEHQVPHEVKRALASAWGGYNWTTLALLTKDLED